MNVYQRVYFVSWLIYILIDSHECYPHSISVVSKLGGVLPGKLLDEKMTPWDGESAENLGISWDN